VKNLRGSCTRHPHSPRLGRCRMTQRIHVMSAGSRREGRPPRTLRQPRSVHVGLLRSIPASTEKRKAKLLPSRAFRRSHRSAPGCGSTRAASTGRRLRRRNAPRAIRTPSRPRARCWARSRWLARRHRLDKESATRRHPRGDQARSRPASARPKPGMSRRRGDLRGQRWPNTPTKQLPTSSGSGHGDHRQRQQPSRRKALKMHFPLTRDIFQRQVVRSARGRIDFSSRRAKRSPRGRSVREVDDRTAILQLTSTAGE